MSRARYLLGNINLINILLTGVLLFLVNYMLLPFLNKSMQYSPPMIKKSEEIDSGSDKEPDQTKTPSPLDYAVIVEQNLFHPERKIPVEKKEAQPLPKPDFALYGTLISDDIKLAFLEDKKSPFSTPGRGTRPVALQIGQTLSGYIVKKIYHEKVIMARGEEGIEIKVVDNKRVKASEAVSATPSSAQTPPS